MKSRKWLHLAPILVPLVATAVLLAVPSQPSFADEAQSATQAAAQPQAATALAKQTAAPGVDQQSDSSKTASAAADAAQQPATAVNQTAPSTTTAKAAKTQPAQGPWLAADEYVTVTAKYATWASFNWTPKLSSSQVYQHTYHVTGQYHHKNGNTYLSLYSANGSWQGYINAKAVTVGAGVQGIWRKASGYATFQRKDQPIYSNFTGKVAATTSQFLGNTYHVTGVYDTFNQGLVYSLGDDKGKWLGYCKPASFTFSTKAQGVRQALTGNYQVKSGGYNFWKDFNWHAASSTKSWLNQYVAVDGQYHHVNGSVYYSVYDLKHKWLGYLNKSVLSGPITAPQGSWHADDRYVTVTSKNYPMYDGFNFHVVKSGTAAYLKTLHATGKYYHLNGSTYLSLYDHAGRWQGYINQKAVTVTGKQGVWAKASGYTTFTGGGVSTVTTVGGTSVKTAGNTLAGNTYQITGQYHTFDGKIYYSLYTNRHVWIGYVDSSVIKTTANPQGLWLAHDSYITTTKKGQKIWSSLKFTSGISTSAYYQITYQVKGMYHHFNGSTYYSLYKAGGHWLGYVNRAFVSEAQGAQGAWLSNSYQVMITSNGYPIWGGFFNHQKSTSNKLRGNTYRATGKYHHFNGSTYLSLYSGKQWIGYINADATTPVGSRVLNVAYASQFRPYYAPEGCAAVSLFMALRYKGVSVSQKYLLDHLPMYPTPGGQRSNGVYNTKGFVSVIEPSALTAFAHNWYAGAKNISGSPVTKIMEEVLSGNPVIVWGYSPYHGTGGTRSHTHVVVGYDTKKGFKIYDPAYNTQFDRAGSATGNGTTDRGAIYWISVGNFTTEWAHQFGKEAVSRAVAIE